MIAVLKVPKTGGLARLPAWLAVIALLAAVLAGGVGAATTAAKSDAVVISASPDARTTGLAAGAALPAPALCAAGSACHVPVTAAMPEPRLGGPATRLSFGRSAKPGGRVPVPAAPPPRAA